jgi:hypothetical protein
LSGTLRGDYGDSESDWNSPSLCKTAIDGVPGRTSVIT